MATRGSLKLFGAVLLGLSLAACSSAHIKRTEVGYAAYYDGALEQAEEEFQSALNKVGDYEPALTGLGLVAYERGDYNEARKAFDAAVKADRTADAVYGRGITLLKLFQWGDALTDLEAAADAQLVEANLELGMARMLTGDGAGALEALTTYSSLSDTSAERRLIAAEIAYRSGLKFNLPTEARRVVEMFNFEEDSKEAAAASRLTLDLAVAGADYPTAMRIARRAPDDLHFGFEFRELSPVSARTFEGLGGAVVDYVHVGSPAELGGLKAGDILTGFKAFPVESAAALQVSIDEFQVKADQQDIALFEVLRDDTYYAAYMHMGRFEFDERIREIRDSGTSITLSTAPDDMAMWP